MLRKEKKQKKSQSSRKIEKEIDHIIPYTIAMDLDGCLATFDKWQGIEVIGAPVPEVVGKLVYLKKKYPKMQIIIHSARIINPYTGKIRQRAVQVIKTWLKANSVPYNTIWTSQGKPYATEYVDDRAVNVVDWIKK